VVTVKANRRENYKTQVRVCWKIAGEKQTQEIRRESKVSQAQGRQRRTCEHSCCCPGFMPWDLPSLCFWVSIPVGVQFLTGWQASMSLSCYCDYIVDVCSTSSPVADHKLEGTHTHIHSQTHSHTHRDIFIDRQINNPVQGKANALRTLIQQAQDTTYHLLPVAVCPTIPLSASCSICACA